MPSRADLRLAGEWLCRGGALGLLAWAMASAVGRDQAAHTTLAIALDTSGATAQLAAMSPSTDVARAHVALDRAPAAVVRDWLGALHDAGTRITWSGDVAALAIAAEPLADPHGAVRVTAAAPESSTVIVADAVGRIDSLVALGGGITMRAPSAVGMITARAGGSLATARTSGTRDARAVVVLGRAGWESRFTAAALVERGWTVNVRLRVAPGLAVGTIPTLDTARVSAVVALDTTAAASAVAIAAYVRSGGGLIVTNEAARAPAFAALTAGAPGAAMRGATSFAAVMAPVTQATLAHAPIVRLRADAVVVQRRGNAVLVAARRVEAGRVIQVGYDETWRWRMAGGDGSPAEHRAWWAGLIESVAYAPVKGGAPAAASTEPAPLAALVASLGGSSAPPSLAASGIPFDPSRSLWVYIAVAALLLTEWASRRIRGAK